MFSYRHAFHAGNHADVLKHTVLIATLQYLLEKDTALTVLLAALIATPLTLPLLAWQQPGALLPMCVLTGLIVWRHRSNLRDLLAGRERHF